MTHKQIRAWFESRLKTWATANALQVAWENVSYESSPSQSFVQFTLLPAATVSGTLCSIERKGIAHINLFVIRNNGPQAAETLAEALEVLFASGTYGELMIDSPPTIGQGGPDDSGHWMIPIQIPYLT